MTDQNPWESPGGTPDRPRPQYGEYAPGAQGAPAPQPTWTPPPKPGLIPLRPLTLGDILGGSFQVLRRNPRPTFGAALLLNGVVLLLSLVVVGLVSFFAFSRAFTGTSADEEELVAGAIGMIALAAIIPGIVSIVVSAILQGIIALEVARGTVGEKLTLRGLWNRAKGRIGALIGWSFLVTLAAAFAILLVFGGIVLFGATGGTAGIVGAVLLGVFGGGALLVAGFWLGTRLSLVPSALLIERLPLGTAIRRSWTLTIGYFWRTLGIQLLVSVIISVVSQIVTTPVSLIFGMLSTLVNPTGDNTAAIIGVAVVYVVLLMVTLVFGAIAIIVQTAASALIYIDLRIRKEGLDLELTRFVEARQSGDATVADPYAAEPARPGPGGSTPSLSPWA